VWVGKWQGFHTMGRVYGPELMLEICRLSVARGYTHFFYGGKPGLAEQLGTELSRRFPGLRVVGTFTPPFRDLDPAEEAELLSTVAKCKPDFFWVGLSTPKQERFMAEYLPKLKVTLMVGVGAAFDIHSGQLRQAPHWMQRHGLEWLFRLGCEPRRLWRRYCRNNPLFVLLLCGQALGLKKYHLE
jgi:N-acetylglucosaminyldiphosphoundecaprenol N-acetyl-beta-D-mannosaminyltransferase